EDSFEEMSMTSNLGIFLGRFLVEELALEAMKMMINERSNKKKPEDRDSPSIGIDQEGQRLRLSTQSTSKKIDRREGWFKVHWIDWLVIGEGMVRASIVSMVVFGRLFWIEDRDSPSIGIDQEGQREVVSDRLVRIEFPNYKVLIENLEDKRVEEDREQNLV
nr:hypothetical protein [Tanacetum cinerariifolium]